MKPTLTLLAATALALAASAADRVHFPGAHWERRDPASLGLDGAVLDRLAEVGVTEAVVVHRTTQAVCSSPPVDPRR